MKKIVLLFVVLVALMVCLTACGNYNFLDGSWKFARALIELPGGDVIEVQVESWNDSEDGEQLTIHASDGQVYLVSANNCVMMKR